MDLSVLFLWIKIYGFPPCFGFLGSTKAFLWGFFLRRARKANVANIKTGYTKMWFDVIGPIYIFIYWVLYVALTTIFFSGKPNDMHEDEAASWCLFESWQWWFVIFATSVDSLNCIVTLILFVYPLLKSVNRLKTNDNMNNKLLLRFINAMRWNVCLSCIATISSVTTLVAVPIVKEYIWLFCVGDPFVNSVCVFFMMASNRKFVKNAFCREDSDESQTNDETANVTYNMSPIVSGVGESKSIEKESKTKSVPKKFVDIEIIESNPKIPPSGPMTLQRSC